MTETKISKTTILLSVVLATLASAGVSLVDLGFTNNSTDSINFSNNVYFCVERPDFAYNCDGFSKYVSEEGKCINATNVATGEIEGNKICRSGWKLIEDDMTFDPIIESQPTTNNTILEVDVYYNETINTLWILDEGEGIYFAKVNDMCVKKTKNFNAIDILNVKKLGKKC